MSEDFDLTKITVVGIDIILREFYTTNKEKKGSDYGRRVIHKIIKQTADSQRAIYENPKPS